MERRNLPLPTDGVFALLLGEGHNKFPEQANNLMDLNYATAPHLKVDGILMANDCFLGVDVDGNDFGNLHVLQYLVHELKMYVNKTDIDQALTLIEHSMMDWSLPALSFFLEHGTNLHNKHKGVNLVQAAVEKGLLEIVTFLLSWGAHVGVKPAAFMTLLVDAHREYTRNMRMIMEPKTEFVYRKLIQTYNPLSRLVEKCLEYLLEAGENPYVPDTHCTKVHISLLLYQFTETLVDWMIWNMDQSKHNRERNRDNRNTKVYFDLCLSRSSAPALPIFSKMNKKAVDKLRKLLEPIDEPYIMAAFEESINTIDISQLSRQNTYEQYVGVPRQQTAPSTCAIVSSAVCVETLHRWVYEKEHGIGTFPFVAATPRKLRSACRRAGLWTPSGGAYVGSVLKTMKEQGGIRTTNAPTPAPSFLPLRSYKRYSWASAEQIIGLLDREGPFVGTIWLNPWYFLFGSEDSDECHVYRSGCGQDSEAQEASDKAFGWFLDVGFHSVVCFAYRVCAGELHVQVLDNQTANGPKLWIDYRELEFVYSIEVERMDPPFHLGDRPVVYPPSGR